MGVKGHVFLLPKIKGTHIVQASRMVFMLVGKNNGIEPADARSEHLLPKVGTGIKNQALAIYLQVQGCTEPLIAEIQRLANRACTADNGYTLRGSCT